VSNSNGTASKTAIITVLEGSGSGGGSSSHSSGGGGGGGAGGSPEPQSNVEVKELSQAFIASGNSVRFEFPRNATSVVYITFNSKKTAGKTTTIVEILKGKSTLVSQLPSGEVYKSLNIWVVNSGFATPNNIENSVVCFKVEKSWMKDKGINLSLITLNRYSDKKWNQLPTSLLSEDSKYLYFTAQTPGFSPFAITGNTIAKETVTKTQPAADTKIQPGAITENILQSSAVSETVQRSEQKSEPNSQQKSEKGKRSNLPIFGMICMIALLP
jgi:PGF-pre-PGF domain-containing protein